jgi:hypothetical protein
MRRYHFFVLPVVLLVACMEGNRATNPSFAISDATHGVARNPFFFWLPPLVPAPASTGEFNPFARPVVSVCELAGSACAMVGGNPVTVATFTMSSGLGSDVIRVSDGEYTVNWRTDLSNLDPANIYRITVSVDGRLLGFADVEVGATAKELKNVDRNEFVPLVDGRTLPIKFRIDVGAGCAAQGETCVEAIVDPTTTETVIAVDDGDHRLAFGEFPDGWTDGPAFVRITRIEDRGFAPGEGPLGTPFPQFPLFFLYETSAPEPFNRPVRIGVCNVEDPEGSSFHPHDRRTTVLAMGGPGEFRTLPRAPADDILGLCAGAHHEDGDISLGPKVARFLASLVAPKRLEAAAMLLDGGMGGSTEEFTPAGTVDTASVDLTIHDLSVSPIEPAGGEISLSAIVSNSGTTDAASSTISLCAAEFTLAGAGASCNVFESPSIQAGGSVSVSVPIGTLVPGAYTVTANVDTFNVVRESDESNNTAVGPTFGVGTITFESYPGGTPTCGDCKVGTEFASRGVTFSFSRSAPDDTLPHICNSTPNDPAPILIPQLVNHAVTAPASGDPCNGWLSGDMTLTFAPQADTVDFRLRGPDPGSPSAFFPVTAFDGAGAPIPAGQIVHTIVGTYTPVGPGAIGTRREERVTVTNAVGGISRVVVGESVTIKFLDNLRILVLTP